MKMNDFTPFTELKDLPKLGAETARNRKPAGSCSGKQASIRVRTDLEHLEEACKRPDLATEQAREWLRDHFARLHRDGKTAAQAFRHVRRLRMDGEGVPILFSLTERLLRSGRGMLSDDRLEAFLTGFQQEETLTEEELHLLPDALRGACLHALAEMPELAETVIPSLQWLDHCAMSGLLERQSALHAVLLQDPTGVYEKMDEESRRDYRRRAAELGKKAGIGELEAAKRALHLAREQGGSHIGEFLYTRPLGKRAARKPCGAYLAIHLLLPLCIALLLSFSSKSVLPMLLLTLPVRDSVKFLFDSLYTRLSRPKRLPRLDYSHGIPPESRTLAVSVILLTKPGDAAKAAEKLEEYRLANRDAGGQLCFGLLADFGENDSLAAPTDAAVRGAAEQAIRDLNERYGGGFCLLLRRRSYSEADRVWRGRERKRGAIMDLTSLLRGENGEIRAFGDPDCIREIRFLIVLDGDTRLNLGTAARLAGILAHPLQRPDVNRRTGRVRRGYSILQPRVSVSLADAERSEFSRTFAGQGGLDPYGGLNSDVYQDLFGEGSYAGKGILDVDAFHSCLNGRFPPETLLSHDLIEGAYAGCAYVSDVELTEGFPAGLLSYYERQDRWVRGDWQTLPWLGRYVRDEAGRRVKNPISSLSRWKIFDNLCRSLTQPVIFLSLLLAGAFPGGVTRLCALLNLGTLLLRVTVQAVGNPPRGRRYRARALPGAKREFLQFLWLTLLLPYSASVHLSAAAAALYRSLITHRKLLLWVTAAEEDRRESGSVFAFCRRMWTSFAGGVLALLCTSVVMKAMGTVWLLVPILAWAISRERTNRHPVSAEDRVFLNRCAADVWRYFRDTMTEERNYLPPDNVQEYPGTVTAERTSPTNLGMALLSVVSAMDLGLCGASEGWTLILRVLETMKRLPRFRGHFYNWYDTRSLQPLQPAFLSTVDSGNLLACLYVLKSAAQEAGQAGIAESAERFCREMKLEFLYDAEKQLFRIGWDPDGDQPAGGWYDLLESEARITSFLAVARGEVPKKHWQRLGRIPADGAGMSGLTSWTGTMFEYFMPVLFMPAPEGSLLGESLEFCLHMQKRSTAGGVWGKSESAFAEQDAALNYAYKAHGVQALALKRGMDREQVIAPYASFLALEAAPKAAVKNLKRLQRCGAEGKYGFYEAVDFTPERGGEGIPVRCFMAHHLGMSLCSIDNVLGNGVLRERFLRERAFHAAVELLEEKTPVGQRIRTGIDFSADEKPGRERASGFHLQSGAPDFQRPMTGLLTNGRYTVLMNELGYHRSALWETVLTPAEPSFGAFPGLCFFAGWNGTIVPLQPLPFAGPEAGYQAAYDGRSFTRFLTLDGLEFRVRTQVPENTDGELTTVELWNSAWERRNVTVALYLEPALCREESYRAHPAFQRLCLENRLTDGCVTVSRRPGGREAPMSLAVACSEAYEAETDKAEIFGRGGIRNAAQAMERSGSDIRDASEPCVFLRVRVTLREKERKLLRFALAVGNEPARAASEAGRILQWKGGNGCFEAFAAVSTQGAEPAAFRLLTHLASHTPEKNALREAHRRMDTGVSGVWRFGISGDLPIAACEIGDAELLLRCWSLLHRMGFAFDLAIRTRDGGVYGSPEQAAVRSFAEKLGIGGWEGRKGGWHPVCGTENDWGALLAQADVLGIPAAQRTDGSIRLPALYPGAANTKAERAVQFLPERVIARTENGIGRRAWSNVLTNGRLSWLASDDGSGCIWLDNARENRLTPWLNDPLAGMGTESLRLVRDGREISLFAAADAFSTAVEFGFGFIRWSRRIDRTETEVIGFIPPARNLRILMIRIRNGRAEDGLRYSVLAEKNAALYLHGSRTALRQGTDQLGSWTRGASAGGERCLWADYPAVSELVLTLGPEPDERVDLSEAEALLRDTEACWRLRTGCIRLESPCEALDRYVNGWGLYQVLACRLMGRGSLYQSGGAFGFRDQLQDACALIDTMPALARRQILLAAAHQYEAGDVMHWWHPGKNGDKGVRTRCSDDLLWLPYAALLYEKKTGDGTIWTEAAPWLRSSPLEASEQDRYERPESCGAAPLREHAERALGLVWERGTGRHGLLLIGSGDWNDGFDRVQGESVWLSWFAALVFRRFGEQTEETVWLERAETLARAADACFRDGRYLRAFFRDGTPLGGKNAEACSLDSLAQSFAVFSGLADPEKSREAVRNAAALLSDGNAGIVALFTPPFDGTVDPGYIRSYLPGVRENGGQYTHAAVWLAGACLRCGETETGWQLLRTLLPGGRAEEIYQAEPFVLAADVYANPDMAGRGGWSWYTGAAGWFLRTVVEELLGVRVENGEIRAEPVLPKDWPGYTLDYQVFGVNYRISVWREGENLRKEVKKL